MTVLKNLNYFFTFLFIVLTLKKKINSSFTITFYICMRQWPHSCENREWIGVRLFSTPKKNKIYWIYLIKLSTKGLRHLSHLQKIVCRTHTCAGKKNLDPRVVDLELFSAWKLQKVNTCCHRFVGKLWDFSS